MQITFSKRLLLQPFMSGKVYKTHRKETFSHTSAVSLSLALLVFQLTSGTGMPSAHSAGYFSVYANMRNWELIEFRKVDKSLGGTHREF